MPRPELQPCVDCGQLCHEISTRDEHAPDCPHWAEADEVSDAVKATVLLVKRIQAYAAFLKDPPPPPPGSASIGPLFDMGASVTATSIGETLDLLLKGDDAKLLQRTEGNEELRKALGLKP